MNGQNKAFYIDKLEAAKVKFSRPTSDFFPVLRERVNNYFTEIINKKISKMNRNHPDIEIEVKRIITIFNFIRPD